MKAGLQAFALTENLLIIYILLFIISYYNVYFIIPFVFESSYLDLEKSLHTISHTGTPQH